jgi:hypothetical protein
MPGPGIQPSISRSVEQVPFWRESSVVISVQKKENALQGRKVKTPLLRTIALILLLHGTASAQPLPAPCSTEKFAEFDFWLGAWEVRTADGKLAGSNRIEKAHNGCAINEFWTGAQGGTGSSVNYRDGRSGEWVQVWNSDNGIQIDIRGGLTEHGMRLVGTIHYVTNGNTFPFRGLWTPLDDGRVRQFFEQSSDGGETWAPWFEGFYRRQPDDN